MAQARTKDRLVEQFDALASLPRIKHAFITRAPDIDVAGDKASALSKLDGLHRSVREELGVGAWPLVTTEQVHGCDIHVVESAVRDETLSAHDGLVTNQPGVLLGIHVADCCAVFLADPVKHVVGLVHSGKRGTELGMVTNAIDLMKNRYGSTPADIVVQLSPCIRPPHYEIDFAATIRDQARATGVRQIFDDGVCTACDLERFYSYRAEKGRTGRMLALIGLAPKSSRIR